MTGRGLYDPAYEHDACGVALVAHLNGEPSHETVERALAALANLEHRGAAGADGDDRRRRGDPAAAPGRFFRGVLDAELPPPGRYGVAVCFLPHDAARRAELERAARATPSSRRARASSPGATCRSTRRTSARPRASARR